MQTPTKLDFFGPIVRQRLRQDFPTGFAVSQVFSAEAFPRLAEAEIVLLSPLRISVQYDGRDHLTFEIQTSARLACARCLLPLDMPVKGACRFRLFETAAQADRAIDVLDAEEAVCDDDQASLHDLLEDEVLMRLSDPQVHPDCRPPVDLGREGHLPHSEASSQASMGAPGRPERSGEPPLPRQRPFAELDQLLSARTSPKKS